MSKMRSFTFDGVNLAKYGVYLANRVIPALPRTREKTIDIPGRDGKLDLGAELAERPLLLPCILMADTEADFRAAVRSISLLFRPSKGPRKLVFDDEPDKYIMARYAGQLEIQEALQWGEFELPLVAYDPYFYSHLTETSVWDVSEEQHEIVVEALSLPEYPVIRIINKGTGPVSNITITRINTP